MKIAIPIVSSTMNEARLDIAEAEEYADILELRLDYLNEINLERLFSFCQKPKIVTNRHKDEAGPDPRAGFKGSEDERKMYLQRAIELGAEIVDDELIHPLGLKKSGKTRLIVSYHDFEKTPKYEELKEIYERIVDRGADIVKIATMADSPDDCLRMLNLVAYSKSNGQDIVGICMGEYGLLTRICGSLYGNVFTFASMPGKASALGQMDAETLRSICKGLRIE